MSIDKVIQLYSGFHFEGELRMLNRLADGITSGVIVSIGSYRGQSDCALALHAHVPVYCIDVRIESNPEGEDEYIPFGDADRPIWMRNILDLGVGEKVRPINLPSAVVASVWTQPIMLLFIDASHDYASVKADLEAWLPHMSPFGIIALHDNNKPGVVRASKDLLGKYEIIEQSDITTVYKLKSSTKPKKPKVKTPELTRDDPRLLELEKQYASLDLPFSHSLWQNHQNNLPISDFRGDGAYLGTGALRDDMYLNMFNHVVSIDKKGYLDKLTEDGAFGAQTYDFLYKGQMKTVSRDLLDSIMEFYFVENTLNDAHSRWLDIGAGYGRLAHRFNTLYPARHITCVDAVPVSTFLCEQYLKFRKCSNLVEVLPLSEIDTLAAGEYRIASNIHSWSECSSAAINFWLGKLNEWDVKYLFLVPHDPRFVCVEPDGKIGNFEPLLAANGYKLKHSQPKYPRGVNGLYPEVVYYMYERVA